MLNLYEYRKYWGSFWKVRYMPSYKYQRLLKFEPSFWISEYCVHCSLELLIFIRTQLKVNRDFANSIWRHLLNIMKDHIVNVFLCTPRNWHGVFCWHFFPWLHKNSLFQVSSFFCCSLSIIWSLSRFICRNQPTGKKTARQVRWCRTKPGWETSRKFLLRSNFHWFYWFISLFESDVFLKIRSCSLELTLQS